MKMSLEERRKRIVASGVHSGHCHVLVGEDVKVMEKDGETIFVINTEDSTAVIRHLLEGAWMQGVEVPTPEHKDIEIEYEVGQPFGIVIQERMDPFTREIQRVRD